MSAKLLQTGNMIVKRAAMRLMDGLQMVHTSLRG
jgi:hypothetical protein